MVKEKISELVYRYQQQIALYQEMYDVAQSQRQLCETADFTVEDNLEKLNQLLSRRQKQMDFIENSESQIQKIKENLRLSLGLEEISSDTLAEYFPSSESFLLQQTGKQVESLLQEISAIDAITQKFFQAKLELLRKQIEQVQRERKANKAYNPKGWQKEGFFVDRSE